MNIKPVAQGTGAPAGSQEVNQPTFSPEKLARAKAIARGEAVDQAHQADPQVQKVIDHKNKIKFKTQRSVYRDLPQPQAEPVIAEAAPVQELAPKLDAEEQPLAAESNIPYDGEETIQAEDVKPLSPQYAALAKAKRAFQEQEKAFKAEKEAFEKNQGVNTQDYISKADLKANLLGVLEGEGFNRDQIAEMLLDPSNEISPAVKHTVSKLEAKIIELESKLNNQNKTQSDRDILQRQQALTQIGNEVDELSADGEDYALIREKSARDKVLKKIEETFDKDGYVMDTAKAMKIVEDELFEEEVKEMERLSKIKKLQGRLTPVQQAQTAQQQNTQNNGRVMRTLTNRDGASAPLSARERAINAFHGRKT